MRNLASIRKINNLQPIEGKDRIVLATIDGWSVIVKKDEFNIGDLCVYVEIDSVLPDKPEFDFLKSKRIKTMKMGGVISQGICFPLSILPKGNYNFGDDVTDIIGIKQYEETMDIEKPQVKDVKHYPQSLMRHKWFRKLVLPKKEYKGFPKFVKKTDEIRVQNIPGILEDRNYWIATEKIDGQSATYALVRKKSKIPFFKDKFEFIVCSRNLRIWKEDKSSYWTVANKYCIKNALNHIIKERDWVVLQGEIIGPGIQGNKYKRDSYEFFAFNLIFSDEGRWVSDCAKMKLDREGIPFVPILGLTQLPETVEETLKFAHGKSAIADTLREGIVFRDRNGDKSFKAVDPLFLLKHDE